MYSEKREELVRSLKRRGYLESQLTVDAFRNVPRESFVPERLKSEAYADNPLPIGQGQTISAPSMIAIMLEALELKKDQKVLEIGTGSGYNAALLAEMVGPEGEVYTIERLDGVADIGRGNLEELGYNNVEVIVGDGTKGYSDEAPYDRVLVTACAPEVPETLIEQIGVGGRLAAPVGDYYMSQTLKVVEKVSEGETEVEKHGGCAFVPLVGEYGWDEGEAR